MTPLPEQTLEIPGINQPSKLWKLDVLKKTEFQGGKHRKLLLVVKSAFEGTSLSKSKNFELIFRELHDGDDFFESWTRLKEMGFPVLSTIREAHGGIFMFNRNSKNQRLYGRGIEEAITFFENGEINEDLNFVKKFYSTSKTDQQFFRIVDKQMDSVRDEANKWAEKANEIKIILPEDPFYLDVESNGNWKLLMLDTQNTSFDSPSSLDRLSRQNFAKVDEFILSLQAIRKSLRNMQTTLDI